MTQLYRVDSPINREQRNNINATFSDILIRFTNLKYQLSILAGGEDLEEILQRIEDVITNANNTTANTQQVLDDISDALDQLTTALQNSSNATQAANNATSNAQNAISDMQNFVNQLGNAESYDSSKTYLKNNIVEYNGSSFIALQQTNGNTPPTLPTKQNDFWQLLAQRGVDGSGSVSSVNGQSPDVNGNVELTAENIGAASNGNLTALQQQVNTHLDDFTQFHNEIFNAQNIESAIKILDYRGSSDIQQNSFTITKDNYSSTGGLQKTALFVRNSIASNVANEEVGIFSVLDVYGNPEHHVGIYSQVNASGADTSFLYGGCIEIKNIQPDGTGTTSNQALIGLEIDMVNKYGFDGTDTPTTRKTGLSLVAFGGGTSHEAIGVYSSGAKNGDGSYMSGDWLYGLIMRTGSIDESYGTGILIQSDHSTGLKITGKAGVYGIALEGSALNAGSVGININENYSIAMAVPSDKFIKINGASGTEGIFYDSVVGALTLSAGKLSLLNHTAATSATSGTNGATPNQVAGYIKCFVEGVERRIPYYNV